jgi:hypothetical protein
MRSISSSQSFVQPTPQHDDIPAYINKVVAAWRVHGIRPGTVTDTWVLHDPDCPRLRDGPCRCDPDVRIVSREEG